MHLPGPRMGSDKGSETRVSWEGAPSQGERSFCLLSVPLRCTKLQGRTEPKRSLCALRARHASRRCAIVAGFKGPVARSGSAALTWDGLILLRYCQYGMYLILYAYVGPSIGRGDADHTRRSSVRTTVMLAEAHTVEWRDAHKNRAVSVALPWLT